MSRRIDELHPEVAELCREFLSSCVDAGHPMIVVFTYRSFEEQAFLYAKGRSMPGPRVTNAPPGFSWHNFRRAFDVVFVGPGIGQVTWNGPWDMVGDIGRKLGLVWGGNFITFPDRPHFEWHPDITLAQARERDLSVVVV